MKDFRGMSLEQKIEHFDRKIEKVKMLKDAYEKERMELDAEYAVCYDMKPGEPISIQGMVKLIKNVMEAKSAILRP